MQHWPALPMAGQAGRYFLQLLAMSANLETRGRVQTGWGEKSLCIGIIRVWHGNVQRAHSETV